MIRIGSPLDYAGGAPEEVGGQASMSRSSLESGAVEQDVVFSTSLPKAYQGRPEDDWTLEARHASLIIGGQVIQERFYGQFSKAYA